MPKKTDAPLPSELLRTCHECPPARGDCARRAADASFRETHGRAALLVEERDDANRARPLGADGWAEKWQAFEAMIRDARGPDFDAAARRAALLALPNIPALLDEYRASTAERYGALAKADSSGGRVSESEWRELLTMRRERTAASEARAYYDLSREELLSLVPDAFGARMRATEALAAELAGVRSGPECFRRPVDELRATVTAEARRLRELAARASWAELEREAAEW